VEDSGKGKVKVKVTWICIALHREYTWRSGVARVLTGVPIQLNMQISLPASLFLQKQTVKKQTKKRHINY